MHQQKLQRQGVGAKTIDHGGLRVTVDEADGGTAAVSSTRGCRSTLGQS